MIEANEINSTFYALRMLSHGLAASEIEVIDGEEYPASEFTKEEQEQALKIIHCIEDSESISFDQLPPEKVHFYLDGLAERIEELANSDLAKAGYTLDPLATFFSAEPLSPGSATPEIIAAAQELDLALTKVGEINPQLKRIFQLYYLEGYSIAHIAEVLDLPGSTISRYIARGRRRQA